MLKLGEFQKLVVIKKVDFGVYLAEDKNSEEKVLLPVKQVPEETRIGEGPYDCNHRKAPDYHGTDCSPYRKRGNQNRSIFGLGIGKGFVPPI